MDKKLDKIEVYEEIREIQISIQSSGVFYQISVVVFAKGVFFYSAFSVS
jgi:hypothetical protein